MASPLRPSPAEAFAEWRRLVEADAEQVGRLREDREDADYYAPIAGRFRPGQRPSLEWPAIARLAQPGDTWLDIGAGGGRFAVPLARQVARVIAVEPSPAMRTALSEAVSAAGVEVEVHDARWPDAAWTAEVDVSLAAHCLYDAADLEAFLAGMERHTRRTCVVVLGNRARGAQFAKLWAAVHGEPMQTLPSLTEFVGVLGALGRRYDVATVGDEVDQETVAPEDGYARARRFLWLAEGSARDARMRLLIDEWYGSPEGLVMPSARPWVGVVSWTPA